MFGYLARLLSFSSRTIIISLENLFSTVLTNCSRNSFWVDVHTPYPFFLAIIIGVHMVIYPFTLHRSIFIFTVQVYIYILIYTIPTSKNLLLSFNTSTTLPSINLTPLYLRLPWAVRPQELVTLTIRLMSLSTCTNMVHQVLLFYFHRHITVFPQLQTLSRPLTSFIVHHERPYRRSVKHCSPQ